MTNEYVQAFELAIVLILVISVVTLAISNLKLWIEFKGMKESTHSIQYIDPLKSGDLEKVTEEVKKELADSDKLYDNIT